MLLTMEAGRHEKTRADAASIAAIGQQILSVARNEKLPAAPRLTMTAAWLNIGDKLMPPEVCREAAAMLTSAWQARKAYEIRDAESIFRAILALPDAGVRIELLKPLLAAATRISCIRVGATLDEQLVAAAAQCGDKALLERVAGSRNGRTHHGFLAALLKEGSLDDARRWFG
jgi:hypothetical protein